MLNELGKLLLMICVGGMLAVVAITGTMAVVCVGIVALSRVIGY
jgi:hypothetical protein